MEVHELEVVGNEEEGGLRHSLLARRNLGGDPLTKKGNTQEDMHKNASQLSHMLDLVTGN